MRQHLRRAELGGIEMWRASGERFRPEGPPPRTVKLRFFQKRKSDSLPNNIVPLTISTQVTATGAPQVVTRATLEAEASRVHSPFVGRVVVGVTVPRITASTRQLSFAQRSTRSGNEFRFDTGTLGLTITQSILLANDVAECPRGFWATHEADHVADNAAIGPNMDVQLRADTQFMALLDETVWRPRSEFQSIQRQIIARVGAVFGRLTEAAATARDTDAEYARVEAAIRAGCP